MSGPIATAPTGNFVFGAGPAGFEVAAIDRATGELTAVPGSPFANVPYAPALAVTPNGHFLIVGGESSVTTFSIDGDTGAITPAGSVSLQNTVTGLGVSPSSNFVYVATDNALFGYAITPQTGALTLLQFSDAVGSSPVISADGKYLYSDVLTEFSGAVTIYAYSVDAQSGFLAPVAGSPFNAAPSPYEQPYFAIDPTGRFLYETAPPVLAGYLINPLNGGIEDTLPGSPFPVPSGVPVGIVIDPSGHYIYTPDADANVISEFAFNAVTGSVSAIAGTMPQVEVPGGITTTAPRPASTAKLTSLAVEPSNPVVIIGETATEQFTAAGAFSDGSHRFLTASVTWSSRVPSVATISNTPGQSGAAMIVSSGSTVIEATLDGLIAKTTLTVAPTAVLVSIALTPATPAVEVGTGIQFTAKGTYGDGTMKDLTDTATWKSSNATVAGVNQRGRGTLIFFRALQLGHCTRNELLGIGQRF